MFREEVLGRLFGFLDPPGFGFLIPTHKEIDAGRSRSWSRSRFFQDGVGVAEIWSTPQHC